MFFEKSDSETLFYKAEVRKKTEEKFGAKILAPPEPGFSVKPGGALITVKPTFLAKSGQTLTFSNHF
jgi:hypothetical protein